MASKIVEKVPGWIARFPEIQRVVEKETEHLRNEVKAEFKAINTRLDEMDKRFDLVRDVTLLKAEVKELRAKIAAKA